MLDIQKKLSTAEAGKNSACLRAALPISCPLALEPVTQPSVENRFRGPRPCVPPTQSFGAYVPVQRRFRRGAETAILTVQSPGWPCDRDKHPMPEVGNKENIITSFRTHEKDTGSCEVQIALLSARITHLTEHLRDHRKDFHSRCGLLLMTSKRRRLLNYLKKHNLEKYTELLQKLNLRK